MTTREEALVDAVARAACQAMVWFDPDSGERMVAIPAEEFDRMEGALAAYEGDVLTETMEVAA